MATAWQPSQLFCTLSFCCLVVASLSGSVRAQQCGSTQSPKVGFTAPFTEYEHNVSRSSCSTWCCDKVAMWLASRTGSDHISLELACVGNWALLFYHRCHALAAAAAWRCCHQRSIAGPCLQFQGTITVLDDCSFRVAGFTCAVFPNADAYLHDKMVLPHDHHHHQSFSQQAISTIKSFPCHAVIL